ncbi:uncharacterized protein [Prorops nasuta]|uniref:uncharacterized protein n=1 Tax=Prorops nasuta TaxID=863751 RepID=UPI0034CE2ABE
MAVKEFLLVCLAVGLAITSGIEGQQDNEESLRSALNAVTRKQRSLDGNSQDYYSDLRSFRYHGPDADRKFDDEEPIIEFLSEDAASQKDNAADDYQHLRSKLLENAVLDYLKYAGEQEAESAPSVFRERERMSGHKRSLQSDRSNSEDNKKLAKLFLEELQHGSPYGRTDISDNDHDEDDYSDVRQVLYDRYRSGQRNKLFGNEEPITLDELLSKYRSNRGQPRDDEESDFSDRDQSILYSLPAERRNVNGRYPLGYDYRNYRALPKRFSIAKRSPKLVLVKGQTTDAKVAQDLGAIFGSQKSENHSHAHEHNRSDHQEGNRIEHHAVSGTKLEKPAAPKPEVHKENVEKISKAKNKPIEMKKKSVDWSQYFGIDRRKKKSAFLAKPGSRAQDEEWLVQRYYDTMAGNLKPIDLGGEGRKDRTSVLDLKLKEAEERMMEEAWKNNEGKEGGRRGWGARGDSEGSATKLENAQKIFDGISLTNSDRALEQFYSQLKQNSTHNDRKTSAGSDKRNLNRIYDDEDKEDGSCPEFKAIVHHCRNQNNLLRENARFPKLEQLCILGLLCKSCSSGRLERMCMNNYLTNSARICGTTGREEEDELWPRSMCESVAILMWMESSTVDCQRSDDGRPSCLKPYYLRYLVSSKPDDVINDNDDIFASLDRSNDR